LISSDLLSEYEAPPPRRTKSLAPPDRGSRGPVPSEDRWAVKTSITLLRGAEKSQRKTLGGDPPDLPFCIAAINIQALKPFKNRIGIAAMNVKVREHWSQLPPDVDSD